MTSKQDQVFGANPRIGKQIVLLSCFNMTHPISRLQVKKGAVEKDFTTTKKKTHLL